MTVPGRVGRWTRGFPCRLAPAHAQHGEAASSLPRIRSIARTRKNNPGALPARCSLARPLGQPKLSMSGVSIHPAFMNIRVRTSHNCSNALCISDHLISPNRTSVCPKPGKETASLHHPGHLRMCRLRPKQCEQEDAALHRFVCPCAALSEDIIRHADAKTVGNNNVR